MAQLSKRAKFQTLFEKRLTVVLLFTFMIAALVGILGTSLAFTSGNNASKVEQKSVAIDGTDGLMGSYGYDNPFKNSSTVVYTVAYNNESQEDRFVQIKATMRENSYDDANATAKKNNTLPAVDLGGYRGVVYSEKKMVKAGASENLVFPVSQYAGNAGSIELEAFKTKTD